MLAAFRCFGLLVMALGFGVLIVLLLLAGSLWIMANLNHNMMPVDQIMQMQR